MIVLYYSLTSWSERFAPHDRIISNANNIVSAYYNYNHDNIVEGVSTTSRFPRSCTNLETWKFKG